MSTVKKQSFEMDMTQGPLLRKIILFALPIMFTGMLQLLYNAADVVVIGIFAGDTSLAAVTSTGTLTGLLVNLFLGMATGSGVIIAQAIGANNREKLHRMVHTAMSISVIIGIMVGVFGFFFSRKMLGLMLTPDDVIDLSTLYVKIYFLGLPGQMVYNFGAAIVRSSGDTRRPLIILSLSGIVNVLLNLVFVIFFHLDVAGVAIATITAQYLSAIAIVYILITDNADYKLDLSKLKIYKRELIEVLRYGIPAGLQTSMFSISNMLIQSSINSFGSAVMAGNGAAASIDGFIFVAADSGAQASLTFAGQNYGAKKIDRVKRSMFLSMGLSTVMGILVGLIVLLFQRPLLGLFVDSTEALEAGVVRLTIMALLYFSCGIMNSIANTVRGMGRSVTPMVISMIFVCAFRVFWVYTVFTQWHSLSSLFVSYPVSYLLAIIAHSICFITVFRKEKRLSQNE